MLEPIIYLLIAVFLAKRCRELSGEDNGAFYAKGQWRETGGHKNHPNPNDLNKYITPIVENLHRNETPTWYATYGKFFFVLLAFFRLWQGLGTGFLQIVVPIVAAYLIMQGSSAWGNVKYQGYINVGSGLPFIDEKEASDSEFAVGKYSKWWKRPFSGKNRLLAQKIGFAAVIIGFILGFMKY